MKQPPFVLGPAGWSYADWEGRVYPRPRPRSFHPLPFLASFLDCVEVNATFYAPPRAEHARRWAALVADRPSFRFVAKIHGSFTHEPLAADLHARACSFLEGLSPLRDAGRLAALLAQFPISFRSGAPARDRIERIVEAFAPLPVVLELRHRSFFDDRGLAFVERLGASLATIDLPAARDHPPAGHACPGELGYVRLHGRNASAWFDARAGRDARYDYLYPPDELDRIAARIRDVAAGGRQTYVVTNNHYGGKAVANAIELASRLGVGRGTIPETLLATFPRLAAVAEPSGQQRLF